MQERELIIQQWFEMWLNNDGANVDEIFAEDCIYIESWGPKYVGRDAVKRWFADWNQKGRVLVWDIKQYFHKPGQSMVEWYFECEIEDDQPEGFDGVSLIVWDEHDRICYLKEFGCKLPNYEPYDCDEEE